MSTVALARNAMASRFELILHGEEVSRLRAAGEEALNEVERIEAQLSLYRPSSEIAHVNARASFEPVRVSPPVFALLRQARELSEQTGGAFDITLGPLIRAWGFMGDAAGRPSPAQLAIALEHTGAHKLELNEADFTVRFQKPGMIIDLGAIGKGYAIDQAVELLKEAGVTSALLHGGTSTVYAIGTPADAAAWRIGIEDPSAVLDKPAPDEGSIVRMQSAAAQPPEDRKPKPVLFQIELQDQALSVSSPAGKYFRDSEKIRGHVIDPGTGEPADAASFAAVALPSATESDALSTALLVLGSQGAERIRHLRPEARLWVG